MSAIVPLALVPRAVQVFPPSQSLLATANRYHLWVLDHEPAGLDIAVPA